MKKPARARLALTLTLALAALATGLPALRAMMAWQPISDEERAATASTIQPDAGAEVLYRLKQIDDSKSGSATTDEYWRVKIYNETGAQMLSKVDIPYDSKIERIKDLAARVIKPDGSISELDQKEFYDREAVKSGAQRMSVRSFSFPSMEPGVIVEYQFRRASNRNLYGNKFDLLGKMPVRRMVFRFKPAQLPPGWTTNTFFHSCDSRKQRLAEDGFYYVEMTGLKAFVAEPHMPPPNQACPWVSFYPTSAFSSGSGVFWSKVATDLSQTTTACIKKGSNLVSALAADLTRGIDSPDARLAALNDYCRSQIINVEDYPPDGPPAPPDPRPNPKDLRSPDDVIKTKKGRSQEIQILFIALARSLDFEASPAMCPRYSNGPFKTAFCSPAALPDKIAAVRDPSTGKLRFYDPARGKVETGILYLDNEDQQALIALDGRFAWQTTPVTPAEKSRDKRTADLRLDEDGTISGAVRLELTGQAACALRMRYARKTLADIKENMTQGAQKRYPGEEISDFDAPGFADVLAPLVITYKVRVPGYAQQLGQRLFVQPGFFTKDAPPMFTADTRTYDIWTEYAAIQEDNVTIQMPAGYGIEEGSAPQDTGEGDWGRYTVTLGVKPKSGVLVYSRLFEFSLPLLHAANYDKIKKLFDFIHAQDTHVITLRKK